MRFGRSFALWSLVLLVAFHADVACARPAAGPVDGQWAGESSQGEIVGFKIEANAVVYIQIGWTLTFDEPCVMTSGSEAVTRRNGMSKFYFYPDSPGNEPPKVTDGAFTVTRTAGASGELGMTLTGRFTADGALTGDGTFTVKGCKGSTKLTWRATREGSDAPAGKQSGPLVLTGVLKSKSGSIFRGGITVNPLFVEKDGEGELKSITIENAIGAEPAEDGSFRIEIPREKITPGIEIGLCLNASPPALRKDGDVLMLKLEASAPPVDVGTIEIK